MPVGFFDSGIGGLTVLHEALNALPEEDYIYYADTKNVPYGIKSKQDVKGYVREAAEFFAGKGVKTLVIACNTATSVAIEELRNIYDFPIIGMEPAVKPAVEKNQNCNKRVLVFATNLTLKEDKFKNLVSRVDNEHIVDCLPMPGLVNFAEKLEFNFEVVSQYINNQLKNLKIEEYGTIVLGCTHFVYFGDVLKEMLPAGIDIIDGNIGTVNNLKRTLEQNGLEGSGTGRIEFYSSGQKVVGDDKLYRYETLLNRLKMYN